jgi:C-terminal processing protease CtpA/Prc
MALVSAHAQPAPFSRTDALAKFGSVWATVKFLHPQMMSRVVDWDGAFVRAVPKVRAAANHEELAAAVGSMLAELDDPATRVVRKAKGNEMKADSVFKWSGELLTVNIGPYADVEDESALYDVYEQLPAEVAKAKAVIFDLRTRHAEVPGWILENAPLSDVAVTVPPMRGVLHSGYVPQFGPTFGGYQSALQLVPSSPLEAARAGTKVPARTVIIVGNQVPPLAAALWWSGRAAIVAERTISDRNVAETRSIELGGDWNAVVRLTEPAVGGLVADAVVSSRAPERARDPLRSIPPQRAGDPSPSSRLGMTPVEDVAMAKAVEIAQSSSPLAARPPQREVGGMPAVRKDAPYADMTYPDLPHRLLGLFRLWSVMDMFFAYRPLIPDWDATLREFIARFESAKDGKEYALAVMELAARTEDGHVNAWGHPAIAEIRGPVGVPIEVRSIEDRFIVTGKRQSLPADTPIAIGDELVSIDGEPLAERVKRLWKYVAGSHEATRKATVLLIALRGAPESVAELMLRGADGATRTVKVARKPPGPMAASGEIWRVLPGNIGYVDLTRLTTAQVDPMFTALGNTKAIVFDMRGYPNGTAWPIAPRINTKEARVGAIFHRSQVSSSWSDDSRTWFRFDQRLPKSDKPVYTGRTVMLIDHRTVSQAEHTGLFFEAANGTKFIGSNSAGTNGDVTNLVLPGGIYVRFSGQDVRHADGRQLQRIGLVPDVPVKPTVRGIREGRDEVLERAIAYLND